MAAPLTRPGGRVARPGDVTSLLRWARSKVRLRFQDPALEAAWRARQDDVARIPVRYGLLAFAVVLVSAAFGDRWQGYDHWEYVIAVRLFVWAPLLLGGSWAVGRPWARGRTLDLTMGVAVAMTLSVLALMLAPGMKGPAIDFPMYWTGLLMLVHVVTPLDLQRALATGAVVVGSYATTVAWYGDDNPKHLAQHTVFILFAWGVLTVGSWLLERQSRRTFLAELGLTAARDQAERILRSILPAGVVERLKTSHRAIVDEVEEATVLFADLVDFTNISRPLTADQLVALLDGLFTRFERLAVHHGVDKIKTIGDAFMAAEGLSRITDDGTTRMALLAFDMLREVEAHGREHGLPLRLRIGINRGPVVAGILGRSRYAYDLWGDVVNVASRLESHGEPDHVHVSKSVADALRGHFRLESRGPVHIRSVGYVETWWLLGPR